MLPDEQILRQRITQGKGLIRPELAVIFAYAKLTLKEEIAHSPIVDDHYFNAALLNYFPTQIQENFEKEVINHQLRRNIIATLIANDIVNRGGPTFVKQPTMQQNKRLKILFAFLLLSVMVLKFLTCLIKLISLIIKYLVLSKTNSTQQ